MGGLAIVLAVCVPFLILSDYRAAIAVLGTGSPWRRSASPTTS